MRRLCQPHKIQPSNHQNQSMTNDDCSSASRTPVRCGRGEHASKTGFISKLRSCIHTQRITKNIPETTFENKQKSKVGKKEILIARLFICTKMADGGCLMNQELSLSICNYCALLTPCAVPSAFPFFITD